MKRNAMLFLTACMVALGGCTTAASSRPQEASSAESQPQEVSSSQSQPSSSSQSQSEAPDLPREFYEMALDYRKGTLTHSLLVTVGKDGRVTRGLTFPEKAYSLRDAFPDGKTLLLEEERESGGEATAAYYLTMDAATGELLGQTNDKQWGVSPHVILDDNLIGFGSGAVIGGQEDTWQPIKLFDRYYKPLDVTLDFDYGEMRTWNGSDYRENQIVGIGYDRDLKQYMVAFAQDISTPDLPAFSANRLGIAFFDASGKFISSFMPEGYQSPFSHNLQTLRSNQPSLIDGSIVLHAAETIAEAAVSETSTVLFDKAGAMQNTLSVTGNYPAAQFSVVHDGKNEYLFVQEGEQHPLTSKLLLWNDKGVKDLPLPSTFEVEGFPEPFYLSDVCLSGGNLYAVAETYIQMQTETVSLTGIFMQGENGYDLLHLIPAQYELTLVSGENGGVTFSIAGIGVEQESNMNYQDRYDLALADIELLEQLMQQSSAQ